VRDLLIDPSTVENSTFNTINQLYPVNDTLLGGPFHTGDDLFDRAEAWYSDNMFLAPRRLLFNEAASLQPLFAYFFTEFIPGNNRTLGGRSLSFRYHTSLIIVVAHASELALIFGTVGNSVEDTFAKQMVDFYINFVNDLNPGRECAAIYKFFSNLSMVIAIWPKFEPATKQVLQLMRNNITAIPDGTFAPGMSMWCI
jgi:carboxylesterase type B